MRISLLSLFILSTLLHFSCSQNDEIVIQGKSKDIEAQLNYYWDKYEEHVSVNPDSVLYFLNEIRKVAKANKKQEWLINAHEGIAHIQFTQGFLGNAAFNYFEVAKILKASGDLSQLANVYNTLGAIYSLADNNTIAISYYSQAKDIFIYKGSSKQKSIVYRNIAVCYKELGQYKEAQEMLAMAMKSAIESNDFSLISGIHNSLGSIFYAQGIYEKARDNYRLSMASPDSLHKANRIRAMAFNNIGETYFQEGNIDEAEFFLLQATSLKKEIKDPYFMQSTLNIMAKIQLEKGRPETAVDLLEANLDKAGLKTIDDEINKGLSLMIEALIKASESKDLKRRALYIDKITLYSKKVKDYNSMILSTRKQIETSGKRQSLQLAEEKHAMGEELAKAEVKNREIKTAFLVPLFLLICAAIIIYYSGKKNKKRKRVLDAIDGVLSKNALRNKG